MKTTFNRLAFALLAAAVLFLSCTEIKKLTQIEIPVKNLQLNFNATVPDESSSAMRAPSADILTFSCSDTVLILNSEFDSFREYLNKVKNIKVDDVDIEITADAEGETYVHNLELASSASGDKWTIDNFSDYASDDKLKKMFSETLLKVFAGQETVVSISGQTNASSGSNLNIKIKLNGALTVQLIE